MTPTTIYQFISGEMQSKSNDLVSKDEKMLGEAKY